MKILKTLVAVGMASFIMTGCGSSNKNISTANIVNTSNENIKIASKVPYAKNSRVSYAIKSECNIQAQLSEYIKEYAEDNDLKVTIDDAPSESDMVLKTTIDTAVSAGNAFLGHKKYIVITSKLYKNGKLLSTMHAARKSSGGFMGGFKGSCSVLGRAAKSLGKDVGKWLTKPIDNAYLGNTYLIR
jgi:small-conductance mechanosensitive channel